jgi:alkylation response protein AidB-like acyl-CoA dehydrogenase
MVRDLYTEEHEAFRTSVRRWLVDEVVPNHLTWEDDRIVPRSLFKSAGSLGFLGTDVPERFGGGGVVDFCFNAVVIEELHRAGVFSSGAGMTMHNDICIPYLLRYCTPEQADRWLPSVVSGEAVLALAMTEPGAGSDLASIRTTAIRAGDCFVLNGQKTFITNGINADLVICAVKTDPSLRHRGISLLVVERDMPGFTRGKNIEKIGFHAQDTAELFFSDVEVPAGNLLGEEGAGFGQLVANLPQERISIAATGVAATSAALDWTLEYVRSREVFGKTVAEFQNSRFVLAEVALELEVAQTYFDKSVRALNSGNLTAADAARAKWWCTEVQKRSIDRCLQLFGGYGYAREYPIARAYADARVTTIYGGTTEIMKEIVARDLGL